ncbi:class I SAM-dependent methyltransferase [Pseudomaricurvus alcaniphilus]|uniref:class I SAM-dependent methyltransferase n=1 Tax=Pseudomaricurvus alcaniphilus TaxID=1166482 RepID=UPI00140D736E|nr:class I SAM-dependent methyltransferase [Pseudomaricurvus alcaniphilus]NHN36032.1 class I SAM-dependent methyltransferase [Pseudomaricurvus alcaniphilus]
MPEAPDCPLCGFHATAYHTDVRRDYRQCGRCKLVFVPRRFHLSREQEKAEYDRHQNCVDDPGYRRFLKRMLDPVLEKIEPGASGLDFGCGPGPALAAMLREAGCQVSVFDIFYFPDPEALASRYDFITATEVVEHLAAPAAELDKLWMLLKPGGWLGIMTKRVRDQSAFSGWHYRNDPTHISFFHADTFRYLAHRWGATVEFSGADTVLLQKPHG